MSQISAQQDEILDDDENYGNLSDYEDSSERDVSGNSDIDGSADVAEDEEEDEAHKFSDDEVIEKQKNTGCSMKCVLWSLSIGAVVLLTLYFAPEVETVETFSDISTIKANFPEQDEDLWLSFESGVMDVVTLNRPSTFIFLYDKTSEKKVENLVVKLSKFAICNIRECDKTPINLTVSKLNSPRILADYGSLIEEYRAELADKGVMVIHNLEKVRGISAQAFHSFCDEFTPLVQKSLFIFTMKVDKLPKNNNMRFVEEDLKQRWKEVKPDTLVALITRITSMVLEVV